MQPTNTPPQPNSARLDPEGVARTVRAAWAVTRDRLAAEQPDWSSHYVETSRRRESIDCCETLAERDIEQIIAVLADFADRLQSVELLADYAAERAETNDGG